MKIAGTGTGTVHFMGTDWLTWVRVKTTIPVNKSTKRQYYALANGNFQGLTYRKQQK